MAFIYELPTNFTIYLGCWTNLRKKEPTEKISLEKTTADKICATTRVELGQLNDGDFLWFVVHRRYYTNKNYCVVLRKILQRTLRKNCIWTNNMQLYNPAYFIASVFWVCTVPYWIHKITGWEERGGGGGGSYGTGKDCRQTILMNKFFLF